MEFGGETPEQAVFNSIVSDGDKSRGQRESLFSTKFKKIGDENGEHVTYRHYITIVTCTEFENTVNDDDNTWRRNSSKNMDKDNEGREGEEEKKGKTLKIRKVILKNENAVKNYRKPYRSYWDKEKNEGENQLKPGVN